MAFHLAGFACCAIVIFFAGKKLSYYGDMLADLTGMGKAWIGLVLMAAVTSLPELMVGISSTTIVHSPDLAVGDILGACALNLGILSIMDVFTPKHQPLFSILSKTHVLAASFGIMLVSIAGLGLYLSEDIILIPWLGLTSFCFAIVYFMSVRSIYKFHKEGLVSADNKETVNYPLSLRQVWLRYGLYALCIIIAALALPWFAEHISTGFGWAEAFTGTLLLAISTCMPEVAVSIAAIKSGSADMAVGNLLGSNIFNIFILFINDLLYTRGHLLKDAAEGHLLSVFFVILMSGAVMVGLMFPSKQKGWLMSWDTLLLFVLYITNIILLYNLS
jgi:cation:H+ antiporter